MKKVLCHYTIARFIPDLIRDEPRNIGVILLNETEGKYHVFFPERSIKHKIGVNTWNENKKIINHYIEYLRSIHGTSLKNEFMNWVALDCGNIQFSEVKSLVTNDVDSELAYLAKVFVNEKIENIVEEEVNHRFKKSSIIDLKQNGLIGNKKFVENKEIEGGKSKIPLKVDLSFQNGLLHIVEFVDLSKSNKDTYETAYKFEELKSGLNKKVNTISAVKLPFLGSAHKKYYDILKATSDSIYDLVREKDDFISEMRKLVN